jgi:hypothetical protein
MMVVEMHTWSPDWKLVIVVIVVITVDKAEAFSERDDCFLPRVRFVPLFWELFVQAESQSWPNQFFCLVT